MMKNDVVRRRRGWAVGLALGLAILLPACGGDGNGNGGSETFTDTENLDVLEDGRMNFTSPRNGTADATINWNDSDNDIDVFVTRGTCTNFDDVLNLDCDVIDASDSTSKPETLSFGVSNGTLYTVWVFNIGPGDDTVTTRVTVR